MDQNVINDVKRIASGILNDDRIMSEDNFNFLDAENMDSVNPHLVVPNYLKLPQAMEKKND